MKRELDDSIINGERHENKIKERKSQQKFKKSEDVAAVIREFEEIIKGKKTNIIWLAYKQGKENAKFSSGESIWCRQINHYS